jgi:Leucine-rich repeat (LRR) protein
LTNSSDNRKKVVLTDLDGDGYEIGEDCNDQNMYIYPGAPELALDGYDNNCNGEFDEEEIIQFNDINLKNAIAETLNHESRRISNYDILHLDYLFARDSSIVDLKGLEYAIRLKVLDLANNQISNILPILNNSRIKKMEGFIDLVNNFLDEDDCAGIEQLSHGKIKIFHDVECKIELDNDNDGYSANTDCNDSDPLIYPGALEIANDQIDNNCNHLIDEEEIIKFIDINLKNILIQTLNLPKDEIDNYDILKLDSLTAKNLSIVDLRGIEYAANLNFLDLAENKISDISPIVNNHGFNGDASYIDLSNNLLDEKDCDGIEKLINRNINVNHDLLCNIVTDLDNDGFYSNVDCNDKDPNVHPGAIELANDMKDNNCNQIVDEVEIIQFNDINLEKAIASALSLDKNRITNYEILGLHYLLANEMSIVNLQGLEYAVKLKILDLTGNQVYDISPLINNIGMKGRWRFINLEKNHLDEDDCGDIGKLINRNVQVFYDINCNFDVDMDNDGYLSSMDCDDTDPLIYPGAPEISNDMVDNNCNKKIDEIEIVKFNDLNFKKEVIRSHQLKKKLHADIYNHELRDFDVLVIETTEITDLKGLEYAINMKSIDIKNGKMYNIAAMAWLKKLKYLSLKSPVLENISPLKGHKNLNKLFLNYSKISDISSIADLTNLTNLGLRGNRISDISPLEGLSNLTELTLGENNIIDISPIKNLTKLTNLSFDRNQIRDISSLSKLTLLKSLYLYENKIDDITAIEKLYRLNELSLADNLLTDIAPLVSNYGISGSKDNVYIYNNKLAIDECTNIRALINRNVNVKHDLRCE